MLFSQSANQLTNWLTSQRAQPQRRSLHLCVKYVVVVVVHMYCAHTSCYCVAVYSIIIDHENLSEGERARKMRRFIVFYFVFVFVVIVTVHHIIWSRCR